MSVINITPLHALLSVMALSGLFTHGVQAESLITEVENRSSEKSELLTSGKHIHIEASAFAGSTYNLRSQPPANRPRDEDDKDNLAKRRSIGDGFGANYSSSASL